MENHSYSCWLMFYRFYRGGQSLWVICVITEGKGTVEVGCQGQRRRPCAGKEEQIFVYAKISTWTTKHTLKLSVSLSLMRWPAKRALNEQNHTFLGIKIACTHKYDPMTYFSHWLCISGFYFTPPLHFTRSYSDSSNFWSVTNGIYTLYVSWERLSLIREETRR